MTSDYKSTVEGPVGIRSMIAWSPAPAISVPAVQRSWYRGGGGPSFFCPHFIGVAHLPAILVATLSPTFATRPVHHLPQRHRVYHTLSPIGSTPPTQKKTSHHYKWHPRREAACCEKHKVSVVAETVNVTGQTSAQQFKVPPCRLSEDLSALFESKQFSDCTLVATCKSNGPQIFHVHKAILAARSRVFHAMFEHNMTESERNEVAIDDVEPDVLREMLCFMYTGSSPSVDQMAQHLIAAADKYHLDRLKVMCEQALCAALTAENACVTLVLADLYSAEQLRTHAINYINVNATEVMNSEGWKDLVKEHPTLLAEVFKALATQQTPPVVLAAPPKKRIKHCPY
ncbi:hypothetical protein Q1695_015431 [Nippostrongylus brasiliensis]|nr:hypothetical protein Q1695_015431 [Nippostrongylus brasiliensis]